MDNDVAQEIDGLVAALGGVHARDLPGAGAASLRETFCSAAALDLDDAVVHFTTRYGGGVFIEAVDFASRERIPIAPAHGRLTLGTLLGWHPGERGIPLVDARFADQLPFELLPIAEVGSGDLLCVAVPVDEADDDDDDGPVPHERADELRARPGAIWYWHHEAPEDEDLFLVADDLLMFLRGLARAPARRPDTSGFIGSRGGPKAEAFWQRLKGKADGPDAPTLRTNDPGFVEDEAFFASLATPPTAPSLPGPVRRRRGR